VLLQLGLLRGTHPSLQIKKNNNMRMVYWQPEVGIGNGIPGRKGNAARNRLDMKTNLTAYLAHNILGFFVSLELRVGCFGARLGGTQPRSFSSSSTRQEGPQEYARIWRHFSLSFERHEHRFQKAFWRREVNKRKLAGNWRHALDEE
jgi:hypothetical protein